MRVFFLLSLIAMAMAKPQVPVRGSKCSPQCPLKFDPHCAYTDTNVTVNFLNDCHVKYSVCTMAESKWKPFVKIEKGKCA